MHIHGLRMKFPGEPDLQFKDFNLTIDHGEKVLLIGPSGCGKSTLLQLLSGLMPHSIEVPMKAESIQYPSSWGFVFQDPDTQFCMSYADEELAFVLENKGVPHQEMESLIKQALARVGLELDPIHTPIHSLSQGMKQRLALASVLLLDPDVLFLDEPSALLDPEGKEQIWHAVKQNAVGKTIVIVEHQIEPIANWVDRVILFNHECQVIADGKPDLIFSEHHDKLVEYGLWYPEVWSDYTSTPAYRDIVERRTHEASSYGQSADLLVKLDSFAGLRGNKEKIKVDKANISEGSWIAITGQNGAGKSTLLLSLMQLLATTGGYELFGVPVPPKGRKTSLPQGVSFVFQNPELQFITDRVDEEVAYSLKRAAQLGSQPVKRKQMNNAASSPIAECESIQNEVHRLLSRFKLDHITHRHPYHLSVGQKRRLSVAAALLPGTRLLLLDEPTFGQDARNTFAMLEWLEQLRQEGITIVMVTHDLQITKYFATEEWVVDNGQLVSTNRMRGEAHADMDRMVYTR